MDNNDYEKAEKRSFKEYQTSELRKAVAEPNEWLAHKEGFMDGYQLSQAHAENKGTEWQARNEGCFTGPFTQHFYGGSTVIPNRTTIAAMAMRGILSNAAITAAITMSLQTEALKEGITINTEELSNLSIETAAAMSVKYADALLTELNKENNDLS